MFMLRELKKDWPANPVVCKGINQLNRFQETTVKTLGKNVSIEEAHPDDHPAGGSLKLVSLLLTVELNGRGSAVNRMLDGSTYPG